MIQPIQEQIILGEYVPLLVYHTGMDQGKELPMRETFADVGATIADNFSVPLPSHGTSFLDDVKKEIT